MDIKLRKCLQKRVFNKDEPHVYIVSINNGGGIVNIHQAEDFEAARDHDAEKKLRYYEIKRLRNADGVVHYIYRSINKIPDIVN